jgi:cell division protein FtsB
VTDATDERAPGPDAPARAARQRTIVLRIAVAAVVLIGAMFVFVFPISAWLDQRGEIQDAERRLEILREQHRKLEQQRRTLASDEEIERLARDRYGMVRPGEQAWALVPGTTTTTTTPPATTPAPDTR